MRSVNSAERDPVAGEGTARKLPFCNKLFQIAYNDKLKVSMSLQ